MLRHAAAKSVKAVLVMLRKAGMPVIIVMDETKAAGHDKHPDLDHTKKGRHKDGTVHFEGQCSSKIVVKEEVAVHISNVGVVKGDKQADLVRKMLQNCIDLNIPTMFGKKHSFVLFDRGFYSADVMSAINDAGFEFIMHGIKNSRIKDAIEEHANEQRTAVSWYTMKSAEGKEFAFRLIINKNPRKTDLDNIAGRYYVFATTLKCKSYDEL